MPRPGDRRDVAVRFAEHVRIADGDACWEWTAGADQNGYGHFNMSPQRRRERAHRVAWELAHGPIPGGMMVCHHCDNPSCVRVSHLFLGTHEDNMRDRQAKGRTRNLELGPLTNAARTHCVHGHPFDEKNTAYRPDGRRECRACGYEESRRYREQNRDLINQRKRDRRMRQRAEKEQRA